MAKEKQPKVEQDQEVNDAQMKTEAEAKAIIENNLRFYSQGCEVPADALKPIRAGRLKGMSDVNPMWRMKRMTEIFGPVGFGWKYEIVKQWTETYGNEVKCFCVVNLFVRDPETKEWSEPIPGSGGSAIVSMESKYEASTREDANQNQHPQQSQGTSAMAFTGAQLNQAIQEMNATTTEAEFQACWQKWAQISPALTSNGTDFYKAACAKINAIKNPSAK